MEILVEATKPMIELVLNRVMEEINLTQDFKHELNKLQRSIQIIGKIVLNMASTTDEAIQIWLRSVFSIMYDMENMLDVLAYEKQHAVVMEKKLQGSYMGKLKSFCSPKPVILRRKIGKWIKKIDAKIKGIMEEAQTIVQLKALTAHAVSSVLPLGTNFVNGMGGAADDDLLQQLRRNVDMSLFIGRDFDVESLVNILCNPYHDCYKGSSKHIPVVAIVGLGGIGKTSLAKQIYSNMKVRDHFSKTIWISVSQEFNIEKILNKMLEFLKGSNDGNASSELAIKKLEEHVGGKRFLLILDDVWNSEHSWDAMRSALERIGGSLGSAILVTTRDDFVEETMNASWVQRLSGLSEVDSWLLFQKIAFANRSLEEVSVLAIGKRIVQKCKGVPLAVNTIGGMLKFKAYEWADIEKSELWDLPQEKFGILPSLKLSYNHLPTSLKKCFALCAFWPRGTLYEKYDLINRWMALGFIPKVNKRNLSMEDTGENYINVLLSISFLFVYKRNEHGVVVQYNMHDLVYDLARSIAMHERLYLEVGKEANNVLDFQHLTVIGHTDISANLLNKLVMENLRSLEVYLNFRGESLLMHVKYLRSLSLISSGIEVVPEPIGRLKCLKFLDLSSNPIKVLPKSIMGLYNLQSLILECTPLSELLEGLCNLINLRHLGLSFHISPAEGTISQLSHLQILPPLQLNEGGFKISELESLHFIRGKLEIKGLELTKSKQEAELVNLSTKTRVEELRLIWDNLDNTNHEEVLHALYPNPNIKVLRIKGYAGDKFPSRLTKMYVSEEPYSAASLYNLQKIELVDCGRSQQLPTLGHLPCLKMLHISGMNSLKGITSEFYSSADLPLNNGIKTASSSSSSSSLVKLNEYFRSLEELRLCNLPNLLEWCEPNSGTQSGFPVLEVLVMEDCPQLTSTPNSFPSLKQLTVKRITSGQPLLSIMNHKSTLMSLKNVHIEEVVELKHIPQELNEYCASLETLRINDCQELTCLPESLSKMFSLQVLEIWLCPNLVSLPDLSGLHLLRELEIYCNRAVRNAPEGLQSCKSLEQLWIYHCPKVDTLPDLTGLTCLSNLGLRFMTKLIHDPPKWLLYNLPCLTTLHIGSYEELDEFPDLSPLLEIDSLRKLHVFGWEKLQSIPQQLQHFIALRILNICNFDNIEQLPDWFRNLSSLEDLYVTRCCKLKELLSMEAMNQLSKLEYLQVEDCPLLEENIKVDGPEYHKIKSLRVKISHSSD